MDVVKNDFSLAAIALIVASSFTLSGCLGKSYAGNASSTSPSPASGTPQGARLVGTPTLATAPLTMNATSLTSTLTWDLGTQLISLGSAVPSLTGATFSLKISIYNATASVNYLVGVPHVTTAGKGVVVTNIQFYLNGQLQTQDTTYGTVNFTVAPNTSVDLAEGAAVIEVPQINPGDTLSVGFVSLQTM